MEEKTKGFDSTYKSMPLKHAIAIRNELMLKNRWSPTSFNQKRLGQRKPTLTEIATIENVFGSFGIDPWTGKKLKTNGT